MSTPDRKPNNAAAQPARRDLAKIALGGAALLSSTGKATAKMTPIPPGIKVGTSAGPATEENMIYLKQLGVTWVSLAPTPETATAEGFTKMREQWESHGFKVYNIGSGVGPSGSLHNMPEVTLNLPGRDQKIAEYKQYLRYLGKAGIHYTTYAHMGNGIWSSERGSTRGNAPARVFRQADAKGYWVGQV